MKKNNLIQRSMVLGLIGLIGMGAFAGCTKPATGNATQNGESNDSTGEKVTLSALTVVDPTNGDFNNMKIMQQISEKAGVNVAFECVPHTMWLEKKNLVFASNQLPDMFFGGGITDSDINMYSKQGMLLPLDDLIEAHAPNLKKVLAENPSVKKALTSPDGHIYTVPFYDDFLPENIPETLFINKKWLDELGLPVPTTTEEFYTVLKAFKEKDPNGNGKNDEIPFSYMANNMYQGDSSLTGPFGVIDNYQHLMIKDGKVLFAPMEAGYKEGTKWLNQLYTEGLIDPEIFTQDYSQYISKGKTEDTILGVFSTYADENVVGDAKAYSDYITLEPLKGPNGDQLWGRYSLGIYYDKFALTNSNKNPEATMKWIDQFYDEEISIQVHWGLLGENLTKNGDSYEFATPPDGMSIDEYRFKNCPGPYAPGVMTSEMYDKLVFAKDKERKIERYAIYDQYAIQETMPTIRFTEEELNELSVLTTDIDNYVKQMKAQWITGQSDIDSDWEAYLSQLERMNVKRYVEIYQSGYDRYK